MGWNLPDDVTSGDIEDLMTHRCAICDEIMTDVEDWNGCPICGYGGHEDHDLVCKVCVKPHVRDGECAIFEDDDAAEFFYKLVKDLMKGTDGRKAIDKMCDSWRVELEKRKIRR